MVGPGFKLDGRGNTKLPLPDEEKAKKRKYVAGVVGAGVVLTAAAVGGLTYLIKGAIDNTIEILNQGKARVRAEAPAVPGQNLETVVEEPTNIDLVPVGPTPPDPYETIINEYKNARDVGVKTDDALKYHHAGTDIILELDGIVKDQIAKQVSDDMCYFSGRDYDKAGNKAEALRRYIASWAVNPGDDYAKESMKRILELTRNGTNEDIKAAAGYSQRMTKEVTNELADRLSEKYVGSIMFYFEVAEQDADLIKQGRASLPTVTTEEGLGEELALTAILGEEGILDATREAVERNYRNTSLSYMKGKLEEQKDPFYRKEKNVDDTDIRILARTIDSIERKHLPGSSGARKAAYQTFLQTTK